MAEITFREVEKGGHYPGIFLPRIMEKGYYVGHCFQTQQTACINRQFNLGEKNMNQKGFTLIELVVVIVVLGILAAVAVPKFIDLSEEADKAAVKGVAGALGSASAINYAAAKTGSTEADLATDCDQGNLLEGGLDSNYEITGVVGSGAVLSDTNSPVQCVVQTVDAPNYSAAFTAFYVSQ